MVIFVGEKSESDFIHDWEKVATGQSAEQRVYDMLVKKFSNEPCLLVHEFKENDLIKVINCRCYFYPSLLLFLSEKAGDRDRLCHKQTIDQIKMHRCIVFFICCNLFS